MSLSTQRKLPLVRFLSFSCLFAVMSAFLTCSFADNPTRKFVFPKEYPLGQLLILPKREQANIRSRSIIGTARGVITANVPAGQTVMLVVNPQVIRQPERLKGISLNGIDRLQLSYLSMDDVDRSGCDKTLFYLRNGKFLSIDVGRSDTTDAGISSLKGMSTLEAISAYGTDVTGTCIKDLHGLKKLESLDLGTCPLDERNLKDLSGISMLSELKLQRCGLTNAGVKNLNCYWIKDLQLAGNGKINDESIENLKKFSKLISLDIRGTAITYKGLQQLATLPLKNLALPQSKYSEEEVKALKSKFSQAHFFIDKIRVHPEDKTIFAPLP